MGVAAHLGIRLRDYDALIRTFIPHYDEMLDAAAAAVRAAGRSAPVVLDLGVGTGALAVRCLAVAPRARIIGVDSNPGILNLARRRLGARLTPMPGDFQSLALPHCDVVAASLALHHVRTRRRKAELYRRCVAALRVGGVLVTADLCPASNPRQRALDHASDLAFLRRTYSAARARALFRAWAKEDTYFPLNDEVAMLRSAGFTVDVTWRRGSFAVIAAAKAR